ncbi:MAG: NarK/NasA family nitrate transporter [Planctomycetes bacterium]|nr:NarK/NasA family nitrate transporter [Planctomycetota bacterium]
MPADLKNEDQCRSRVLWLSTLAFTVLFAVWLMLGVLGLKIKADPQLMLGGLAEQLSESAARAEIESRFEWLLAVSILAGALPRLNFGIWADRFGGRNVMVALLVGCALPTVWLAYASSFGELLVCAALFGLAGNSFSVGIAWNSAWFPAERKGTALGIFGAGNVGASGSKLLIVLAPSLLTLVPPAGFFGGWLPGGWRIVPLIYSVLLLLTALAIVALCPRRDPRPAEERSLAVLLEPLKFMQVWRFGLYYVVVFGAYVALSAWLPNYYVNTFGLSLVSASLLTAVFIFPASLLRPLGGWLSDKYGPRTVTYAVFVVMTLATIPLCFPPSYLAIDARGFAALLFVVAVGMGIGKASVFKYIPNYYPRDVGAVGGLVGLIGGLGGFWLPKAFGFLGRATGFPQAAFLAMLAISAGSLLWLHLTVRAISLAQRRMNLDNGLQVTTG